MRAIIILSLLVGLCGCQRHMTEREYTRGPFPEQLPAGWMLVTNSGMFAAKDPHGFVWECASRQTACEAVSEAWDTNEVLRQIRREEKQSKVKIHWEVAPIPKSGDWCEVKK